MAVMIAMCFTACDHYDHAIADQGDRLDILEQSTIKNIDGQVDAIKTSLAELEAVDAELEALIKALQDADDDNAELIAALQAKDAELDKKIEDLKTYVDDKITYAENWAKATFATLQQYTELQNTISDLSALVAKQGTDVAELTSKIDTLEESMKQWVNETIAEGYYDISEIDAFIGALELQIGALLLVDETLAEELESLKDALEKAQEDLTEAYEVAIEEAIKEAIENDGVINAAIAEAIEAAKNDLSNNFLEINEDIKLINNKLNEFELSLGKLIERIQSIRFLPEYSDGKVLLNNETTLTFIVSPKEAAEAIAAAAQDNENVVAAYVSRIKARTKSVDMPTPLTVTSVNGNAEGVLEVGVSDANLPDDFWKDMNEGNIYISISDGNNDVLSELIPILPMSYIATPTDFLQALEAAKANGDVVRLSSDIVLETPVTLSTGDDLTIDLNGHSISTESAQTGKNFDFFDVRNGATLTVKNGTITTEHTVNMGWNQSTNVFNVTAGGVLNIENATIKNLGGSDMAFCIHLNNWGEVTLNVNNSTLESTYMAVRVFNSGPDMNNVTIKNSNLKGAKYCFWVHNYTDVDFGSQEKADAQKALLNLDIYNNNNNFDCSVSPARYGFTNSILLDENGNQLILNEAGLKTAVNAGGEFKLANDIALSTSLSISNPNFVLDGNGKTITMADGATNPIALFDIAGGVATIKNVTFDGITGGAVVRTVDADFEADNVTVQNTTHTETVGQGIFRLKGKSTVKNSIFKNNNSSKGLILTLNFDGANPELPSIVDNCVFEGNTCNSNAIVYYVKGSSCVINNNKFIGNTVNCKTNGATVYMGFQENCTVTNNLFKNNTVNESEESSRVAGGVFFGYDTVFTGNAFVGNSVTGTNAKAKDVCVSTYYTSINLSGNYWGGVAPVEDENYFVQHKSDERLVIINDYLTTYNGLE